MSIEHDVVLSTSLVSPPSTFFATIFLILLGWLSIRYRKKFPVASCGVAWFLLNILIESSIVPLELIFEHRLYLPSVGFALFFACVLVEVLGIVLAKRTAKDFMTITCCCFALLISGLTLLTFTRNEAWRDIVTIYEDAALKAPKNPRAHANLAVACGVVGLYERAISEAETAIELGQEHYEQWVVAANAIVTSLNGLEKYEEACRRGEQLLQHVPRNTNATALPTLYANLGRAHLELGQVEKAYAAVMKSLEWTQKKGGDAYDLNRIERTLALILKDAEKMHVDLDQDGISDPGGVPVGPG